MPIQPFNLLKATRISEAQQRVEEAEQQLKDAQLAGKEAAAERASADSEALKASAQKKVDDAKRQIADAQSRADYEQLQLSRLLDCDQKPWQMALVQYAVFGLLAAVVLAFLMYGIISDKLLSSLATIATSRGLITFLITVVTVTIALVLILSSVVSDSPDRARRFQNGKDILVVLIGVLGTIVGFYFGQSDESSKELKLAPVYVSTTPSDAGETITLVTFASGGKPPYIYSIDFQPDIITDIKEQPSRDGLITAKVSANPVKEDTEVSFAIHVSDSLGREAVDNRNKTGERLVLKKKKQD
jgi:hypothetical protein